MRKCVPLLLALTLILCGCERETLTDPVLFCEAFNRVSPQPIRECDAFLRSENEVMLFTGETIIRLQTNADGAIHTVVVTGPVSEETAAVAQNAFTVPAQPLSDQVPQTVRAWFAGEAPDVQTAETKRFFYAVFRDGETVTAVQINRLLAAIPTLPTLRRAEDE